MKKLFIVLLCIQLFTFSASAANMGDFQYFDEFGNLITDWQRYNEAVAYEMVAEAGLDMDVQSYWVTNWLGVTYFDFETFKADYNALVPPEPVSEPEPEPEVKSETAPEPDPEAESEELIVTPPADDPPSSDPESEDSGYSIGSYVGSTGSTGNVFYEDGESFSTSTLPVVEPEPIVAEPLQNLPTVYAVNDMRSSGESTGVLSGLKALIVSIFGEYTPVTTSAVVTETVDGVTTTTLIDVVASGAAGVDYAWIAGVALFGILLYCVMRIFGTVLK